jgi:hypothetical protein
MTPTNTATPSQTPSPPACKCYQFFNETATNGLNMYYYKCGEGFESSETLNGGQIKYRCVNSAFVPYADVTVTECSSVTACTVDTDCNLCT